MNPPVLSELFLDLQVHICKFLHPSHILALRKTCKACHQATSQRVVWVHALTRICYQNSLFLPTFPIPDMSIAELERAAIAPFRWIARSLNSKDRNVDGTLPSRRTQILENSVVSMVNEQQESVDSINVYLVPGGRYLVVGGPDCLGVWDLGYISSNDISSDGKPTKVWATTVKQISNFIVQPTPDGLGIRILAYLPNVLNVFEIYPQNQTHEHAKVAELMLNFAHASTSQFLCGNRAVIYAHEKRTLVVWDFVANTLANWSVCIPSRWGEILRVTETAIIIYDAYSSRSHPRMWIFQIPPLTPQTLPFNHEDLPVVPVIVFKYPGITAACHQIPDHWYYGYGDLKSFPLYLDVFEHQTSNVGRYTLDIAPDLSNLSLTPIPTSMSPRMQYRHPYTEMTYRTCEDSSVNVSSDGSFWSVQAFIVGFNLSSQALTTCQVTAINPRHYTFCPASARFVYTSDWNGGIFMSDFL